MKRSVKKVMAMGMAAVCIMGFTGCSVVEGLMGPKEMEYIYAGKPVDDNNGLYAICDNYSRADYSIKSPVFLINDDEVVIAYSGASDTILARYDYTKGEATKEVSVAAGMEMIDCADNGNMLLKKSADGAIEYYVYDSEFKEVFSSTANEISASEMLISKNGQVLEFSKADGSGVGTYVISEGKSADICSVTDEGQTVETAQMYVSKITEDASSMVITMNVLTPEFKTVNYVYDIANQKKSEIQLDGAEIEVMGNNYITYNTTSGENVIRVYDANGIVDGTATEVKVEMANEMAGAVVDLEDGYMLTQVVNRGNSEYQDGLHLRYYNLDNGLVQQSVLASASSIFTIVGKDAVYSGDNATSWFDNVSNGNRMTLELTSDKSTAIVQLSDDKGVRIFAWKIEPVENTEDTTEE